MAYPVGVRPWRIKEFANAHKNFKQPLDVNQSYDLFIDDEEFKRLDTLSQYAKCTENLQWVIKDAMDKNFNLRAVGSGWSLSKVAVSDDAIVNTKNLRHKFALSAENFHPDYLSSGANPENHIFLQCGNTIIKINEHLEKRLRPAKSLRACGGSNGQTIVGAFSTGTHGAALNFGALSEMVLGLHIVTGPESHVYIERASRPITSDVFHQKLGVTKAIRDDDLFNAALVSFGSFGIIHGVLLEVEDKFLLEQKLMRVAFDENIEKAVTLGDFSAIQHYLKYPLSDPDHTLYHFEMAINPHDFEYNNVEKGAYIRSMYKTFSTNLPRRNPIETRYTYGDDTLGLIQAVLDAVETSVGFLNRALIPKLVNALFAVAYDRPEEATGTIGETFNSTKFRGKLFSAAFGIEMKDVKKVTDLILSVNRKTKLAGVMAYRFVKGTRATLGFTRWEQSCVLELDGADASVNYRFMNEMAKALEAASIKFTLHWGKINRLLDRRTLTYMYGEDNIRAWKTQRSRIMSPSVQKIFNNEFMEACGLDEYVPYDGMPIV